ncbi:MAG: hypothetical protein ACLQJR_29700 [Stellaceae bacterium]
MYWAAVGATGLLVISVLAVGGFCLVRELRRSPWSEMALFDEDR